MNEYGKGFVLPHFMKGSQQVHDNGQPMSPMVFEQRRKDKTGTVVSAADHQHTEFDGVFTSFKVEGES